MFTVHRADGKWVLRFNGGDFEQQPVESKEEAEAKAGRYALRYPADSFRLVMNAGKDRRGGPYRYSFPEEYADYLEGTKIKLAGITGARTRTDAKDMFRYRMEKAGLTQDTIRKLMIVLELESV